MRKRHLLAVPIAAGIAAGVATVPGERAEASGDFTLTDTMRNGSGARSTINVQLSGDQMTIAIRGTGFTPNLAHLQHLHGSFAADKDFTCPTADADKDKDGQVTTEEGLPAYGDMMIALTTDGDTSVESALAFDRMPVADAQGKLSYKRTITLPDAAADKLRNLHVVQHGLDVNGNDRYDTEALGVSTFASSMGVTGVPEEATNPATCGTVGPVLLHV